jgi:hypothetical protein
MEKNSRQSRLNVIHVCSVFVYIAAFLVLLLAYFGLKGWAEDLLYIAATALAHLPAAYWYYNHQEEINSDWYVPRKTNQEKRLIKSSIGFSIGWVVMQCMYAMFHYHASMMSGFTIVRILFCNVFAILIAYGIVKIYKIVKYNFID